jgi:hypothetical protein
MRADYIEKKGKRKLLLERTSLMRGYFTDDEDVDPWKTCVQRHASILPRL